MSAEAISVTRYDGDLDDPRSEACRHALFVAFHFPPEASSSGVLRTAKFVRYLQDFGWRVTVIAPSVAAYEVVDPALGAHVPNSTGVIRTRFVNTKRHLSIKGIYPALLAVPDIWVWWKPFAVRAGIRFYSQDPFEIIYSTSPHATAHLIGRAISLKTGRPWIADFRDPWIEDPPEPGAPSGPVFNWVNRKLEAQCVHEARRIVTSTKQLRDEMRGRYPHEPTHKFVAILNGYDEADFAQLPAEYGRADNELLIVHAGGINPEFRDPRPLFAAVRKAADSGKLDLNKIRFRFIGAGAYGDSEQMREALHKNELVERVEFVPRVPYEKALRELWQADALLLLQASEDTASLVPAKLYEYLRAQKPVLAVVFDGATREILRETGGGWSVSPRDTQVLEDSLVELFTLWSRGTLASAAADLERLKKYERRALTEQLAHLFSEVSSERR